MGREVRLTSPPRRIVSLVPSQTEFLLDVGAPIVGRTKFCIHPNEIVENIPIVGGTKKFHFQKIKELNPDLIVGNKEENYKYGIEKLEEEYPVWMSDIFTLDDAFGMMTAIGSLCDLEDRAKAIVRECKEAVEKVKGSKSGKVIYLIWNKPWMAAGKNTFIDHFLTHLGYENLITEERYPELTTEQIINLNPDKILFSSEPFPFKEKHLAEAKAFCPNAESLMVDGELHSWYGSRLRYWNK